MNRKKSIEKTTGTSYYFFVMLKRKPNFTHSKNTIVHTMKKDVLKHAAFIGKSMLWSLGLYIMVMLVFNWDEVKNTTATRNAMVITANTDMANPDRLPGAISRQGGILKKYICTGKGRVWYCRLGQINQSIWRHAMHSSVWPFFPALN